MKIKAFLLENNYNTSNKYTIFHIEIAKQRTKNYLTPK